MVSAVIDASIVVCSFRPGGIDVLLAGMRDQTYPRERWEAILVDHRYERRHDRVMDLARRYDVPLIHVPEHRRNGKWAVNSSCFNTGFALVRGRVVLMLVDWTYAPPGWIEAHLRHHSSNRPVYVAAPYFYHAVGVTKGIYDRVVDSIRGTEHTISPWSVYEDQPKLRFKIPFDIAAQHGRADMSLEEDAVLKGEVFDELSVFEDGLFDPSWLPRMPPTPHGDPGQRGKELNHIMAHLKNESVLRRVVYKLNGVDVWAERGGRVSFDSNFGLRAVQAGAGIVWEPEALVHCADPRQAVCRVLPFGRPTERIEGRWSLSDCVAYNARRSADARAGKFLAAPAPYTMEELATKLEPWRTADRIDTSTLDVPDVEFFGRDIRPDTTYV